AGRSVPLRVRMEAAPAVPELLAGVDAAQRAGRARSRRAVDARWAHQLLLLEREARFGVGPLEGEERRAVGREDQHDRCAAHDFVDDALALEPVPVEGLAAGAGLDADHQGLLLPGVGVRAGQLLAARSLLESVVLRIAV